MPLQFVSLPARMSPRLPQTHSCWFPVCDLWTMNQHISQCEHILHMFIPWHTQQQQTNRTKAHYHVGRCWWGEGQAAGGVQSFGEECRSMSSIHRAQTPFCIVVGSPCLSGWCVPSGKPWVSDDPRTCPSYT